MANTAEQARARDGSPGRWLAQLGDLAELLEGADGLTLPAFMGRLVGFADPDEALVRGSYRAGVGQADDREARLEQFALAAALCPVVAEPCVWLAFLSPLGASCQTWAACARERLLELGTAWDKRLHFEEWLALINAAEEGAGVQMEQITDPRALVAAVGHRRTGAAAAVARPGRERFHTYVEELLVADGRPVAYPNLPGQPWHDPADFPLVAYLESNYAAIRDEILGLAPARFQRESEGIRRTGDWDVVFLYERGRRHDDICAACPVTTRGVESYPTVRTSAGLIYASRMRGCTHIAAHRGPTNLRLRCHFAIKVPDGDCAIRVGTETRGWEEGRCLVFNDFFEHEAWNHTHQERIVLIIDLWHPALSATEVSLLEGLHSFTSSYARRLARYWARNASAAQET
jgi:aspartate beta-hydroxylase